MANDFILDPEYVRQIMLYDALTGILVWKNRTDIRPDINRRFAGKNVGSLGKTGYLFTCIKGVRFRVHRLAWLIYHGKPANGLIDHIDGDKTNNRISNLRVCNDRQNTKNSSKSKNNTSGYKGVSLCKQTGRWVAQITVDYKAIKIGRFDTKEAAYSAYCEYASKYHGEFARI